MIENSIYHTNIDNYQVTLKKINTKYNFLGTLRLISALSIGVLFYFFLTTYNSLFLILTFVDLGLLLTLIRIHTNLVARRDIQKALIKINQDEIDYLNKNGIPFEEGEEFIDTSHSYSYDLDIFGKRSLFHILNRTQSYIGKKKLAESLLHLNKVEEIRKRQEAVKELTDDVDWRQKIGALAKSRPDSEEIYSNLKKWSATKVTLVPKYLIILSYFLPLAIFSFIFLYINDSTFIWGKLAIVSGAFNLSIVLNRLKTIKEELVSSTKIDAVLNNYSLIIQEIEKKNFQSEKLKELQSNLKEDGTLASVHIKKLSGLFGQLENIQNPLGMFIINALLLYHLHTLRAFGIWKKEHATKIMNWMDIIGEFESLSSLANFAYNNPKFNYSKLNSDSKIEFEELGHPLIDEKTRVDNDLSFTDFNFMILTGSNMSGKSTFLRSLGINMILARTGAPICAKSSNIHPMNVLVSMRLSDSLSDNESYFFAEVKRLKEIMISAEKEISFVLLDEILRGTNSDDKREGTIEVIKKIIQKDTIGAIATHDLKVCDITINYPGKLANKCFEVEIVNNDLYFDYKLREGVCKNKSATFLMKKMGII